MTQSRFINVAGDRRMFQDRFDFRGENKPALLLVKIERFDPGAIAREHQPFAIRIPQSDREIALDVVHKIETALFIQMEDGL